MTPNTRRCFMLIATAGAATATITTPPAYAELLPPPGAWPAPVVGAVNPLMGTVFSLNGGHATPHATLRVWLWSRAARHTAIRRPIGGRTVIGGRLRNRDDRHSISGAALQLAAQLVDGGDWFIAATARTNRRGHFRAVLPTGPTHRLAALYWPTATATSPIYSRRLLVRAAARVRLNTRMLAGRRIVYHGHVAGAPIPPGGLVIAAQVRNGPSWATVRIVRTLASGRFIAHYRFKHPKRRYQVRALVPAQPSWPLYSGHSQSQRITSRP
jgi:hypothetical protein